MNTNKTKLNIKEFFEKLNNLNYVVVKKPEHFPDYYAGSDLDIICDNKKSLIQKILTVGNKYVAENEYEIRVSSNEKPKHTKVDFYLNNEIELRFDIHEGLPKFSKVRVRKDYIFPLLKNKQKLEIENCFVNVPSDVDELVLRYIEYIECFEKRPDKIKHLEYIENYIKNDEERKQFFDHLHSYIKMLTKDDIRKSERSFDKAKLTHTDFRTKIKRELKYRTPFIYKTLIKIKRFLKI